MGGRRAGAVRAEKWFNTDDFEKAVAVARKYYPEPPRKAPPPAEAAFRRPSTSQLRPNLSRRGSSVRNSTCGSKGRRPNCCRYGASAPVAVTAATDR